MKLIVVMLSELSAAVMVIGVISSEGDVISPYFFEGGIYDAMLAS